VLLLRGDVAVLHTESRAVLAAADGVEAAESARQLSDPLEALALGYRSQLSVPLWRAGRRIGALAVLGRSERRFNEADIALLRALAGRLDGHLCSIH
jgi:GAF domain-containing protein